MTEIKSILSWNVNGLRAIHKKNFSKQVVKENPDIICLQEIRLQKNQIPEGLFSNYFAYFNFAVKKGYGGLAVYTKEKPLNVKYKLGFKRFDNEGRIITLHYKKFILINIYLPHGNRTKEHLPYKLKCYDHLEKYLKKIKNKRVILVGDFNIAHEEIDLKRPKQNIKNIMFTPEERYRLSRLINLGFIDTFRHLNPKILKYTWWPWLANARQRNIGWRIDYGFISKKMLLSLKEAIILDKLIGSDHCPIKLLLK